MMEYIKTRAGHYKLVEGRAVWLTRKYFGMRCITPAGFNLASDYEL